MTNKELEEKIYKAIRKIKKMYYKEYPNGDYLSITIYKDKIMFNNSHWTGAEDETYPLDFWRYDNEG